MISADDLTLIKRALTMAHAVSCIQTGGPNETSAPYLDVLNRVIDLERQQVRVEDQIGWVAP